MRALLITVGSRGDAEPFCALASTLGTRGHHVDLFLQSDVTQLAPSESPSVHTHELNFTQMDFYKFVGNPSRGANDPNPRVRFVGVIADCIGDLVFPCCDRVYDVAKNSDVIITSSLARPLSIALSEKLRIPLSIIHLQPLVPTSLFPHYSKTDDFVKRVLEIESSITEPPEEVKEEDVEGCYWKLEQTQHEFLRERLYRVYDNLEIPRPAPSIVEKNSLLRLLLTGHDENTLIVNAFCTQEMIPCTNDTGPNVFNIGALADSYVPTDWEPPEKLKAFLLNANSVNQEPPICIGYGSMPVSKAAVVLQALKELVNVRAVLVGSAWGDILDKETDRTWTEKHILHVSSVPYAWLLPQCSLMLCHGGAGVVHTTIRAGIPVIISPLMGDQFSWAKLIEAKGLGVQAGSNLNTLTSQDVMEGIVRGRKCKEASARLGERLRVQRVGSEKLVDLLETKICSSLEN